jgi:hypothetical protein
MAGNRGRKGGFDFLKLPALSLDLPKEHRTQGLQGIDALFSLSDADLNCRVRLHVMVVGFTELDDPLET